MSAQRPEQSGSGPRCDCMEFDLSQVMAILGLKDLFGAFEDPFLVAGLVFLVTATLIAFSVPGVLLPMALTSGALLGPWQAAAVVALGAVAGSQLFFIAARQLSGDTLRARLGGRFESFQTRFANGGLWYVVGLRLVGAPNFLVTAASALTPMSGSTFAFATLLGMLPAIGIAAGTGSVI